MSRQAAGSKVKSESTYPARAASDAAVHPGRPPFPGASPTPASNSTSALASLFECPVCFDYVLPPILQCQNGHLVCSTCRQKLTCCPTCRGPIGSMNPSSYDVILKWKSHAELNARLCLLCRQYT